jgi:TolB-like protein/DNA-binding winged helix-turn-helix (wHTH) protein/predicted Zn-dependent protease
MSSLTSNLYEFDEFRLDPQNRVLKRGATAVSLTPKAFDVLLLLIQNAGTLVTKDELMEAVWPGSFVEESNLTQTIFMVRKALDETSDRRYILTVQGQGYRFLVPVTEAAKNRPAIEATGTAGPFSLSSESGTSVPEIESDSRQQSRRDWRSSSVIVALVVIVVFVIAASAFLVSRWRHAAVQPPGKTMLAVLPFENLTGDASQEYFSDGMTEEMITQLGSLDPEHLGVIARTSVMQYKSHQEPLQQIAHELKVQYVLEGSVRRDAGTVRITAQLIQMKDQTHLWARQYDRQPQDVLVVQSEIAKEISGEIQSALGEHRPIAPIAQPTLSPEAFDAYNLYLKGQYFWNKRTVQGFQEAIVYFRQATEKNPDYARAYAGLAASYTLIGTYSGSPSAESASQARAAALRALQLDDNLPEAHAALALIVQNHDYDWRTAEKEFKRAIELNPNYATGHHWYAEHLAWRGRFDEALRESERARQLDPLSLIIAVDNGAILYYSRQCDQAIARFSAVRELDPSFPRTSIMFAAYVQKKMFAEAEADIEQHLPGDNPWHWSSLAYTYGRAGNQPKAEQALKKLLDLNHRQVVDPMVIVTAYSGMGNKDQAMLWLEKAYAQHSSGLTTLKVDPAYDPLRDDPRFQNLMRRVGFID